jgi:outer membrane beta-barrel protein
MTRAIWILLALLVGLRAYADDIEVPEEELARETTLPVFNKQRAVLNRNVQTTGHTELALGAGLEVNEPYFNDGLVSLQGTYNYSDTSAINIIGLDWQNGLSSYGEQLKAGRQHNPQRANDFKPFDASKAPHPMWGLFANYEYLAYYGKISLTKQTVMNLNLFGLVGLGYINMGTASTVGLNIGLGQNFFFTQNLGVRADLRWLIFQGPDAASAKNGLDPNQPAPSTGSFSDRIYYNTQLGFSLVYIL